LSAISIAFQHNYDDELFQEMQKVALERKMKKKNGLKNSFSQGWTSAALTMNYLFGQN
jgi:hypothetical protein